MKKISQIIFLIIFMASTIHPLSQIGKGNPSLKYQLGFLKEREEYSQIIPHKITIGLISNQSLIYKILNKKNQLCGGSLHKGLNRIELPLSSLMDDSTTLILSLFLKYNEEIIREAFKLLIEVKNFSQKTFMAVNESRDLILSFYIKDQLISYRKVQYNAEVVSSRVEFRPNLDTGGMNKTDGSYPALDRVNFVNLLAGIIRHIKNKKMKNVQGPVTLGNRTTLICFDKSGLTSSIKKVITLHLQKAE